MTFCQKWIECIRIVIVRIIVMLLVLVCIIKLVLITFLSKCQQKRPDCWVIKIYSQVTLLS